MEALNAAEKGWLTEESRSDLPGLASDSRSGAQRRADPPQQHSSRLRARLTAFREARWSRTQRMLAFVLAYLSMGQLLSIAYRHRHAILSGDAAAGPRLSQDCDLEKLTRLAGGRLAPNAGDTHPIPILMCEAEHMWESKLQRQSKTLSQAVSEYRSRYGRAPPKGFDRWYEFATSKGVMLIDEYDIVNESLQPFWAVNASTIRTQLADFADEINPLSLFVTVRMGEAVVERLPDPANRWFPDRIDGLRELLDVIAPMLEDVDVIVGTDDGPRFWYRDEVRSRMIEAAQHGALLTAESAKRHGSGLPFMVADACPPDSSLANQMEQPSRTPLTFVGLDARSSLDFCSHPEWLKLHSMLMPKDDPRTYRPHDNPFCRTDGWAQTEDCVEGWRPPLPILHGTVLSVSPEIPIPVLDGPLRSSFERPDKLKWRQKKHNKLFWRGATTGTTNKPFVEWQNSQRPRLHKLANHLSGAVSTTVATKNGTETIYVDQRDLAAHYLDIGLSTPVWQCDPDCSENERWARQHPGLDWEDYEDQYAYKFLFDVDGNGWSGRFRTLMASSSAVFKTTIFDQWYRDTIQPWYHYVPVELDYSDLFDSLAYFAGDLSGHGAHDREAQLIGQRGRQWAEQYWRPEDAQAYMMRLLLELARLFGSFLVASLGVSDLTIRTEDDRTSMDFEGV